MSTFKVQLPNRVAIISGDTKEERVGGMIKERNQSKRRVFVEFTGLVFVTLVIGGVYTSVITSLHLSLLWLFAMPYVFIVIAIKFRGYIAVICFYQEIREFRAWNRILEEQQG